MSQRSSDTLVQRGLAFDHRLRFFLTLLAQTPNPNNRLCVLHHPNFECERPGLTDPAFANVASRHNNDYGHDHALIRAGFPNTEPCKIRMVSQVSVVELLSCQASLERAGSQ
jgi:hypothetical protein